jgi:hypothetical protein
MDLILQNSEHILNGAASVAFVFSILEAIKQAILPKRLERQHWILLSFCLGAVPVYILDFGAAWQSLTGSELSGVEAILVGTPLTFVLSHFTYEALRRIQPIEVLKSWIQKKLGVTIEGQKYDE